LFSMCPNVSYVVQKVKLIMVYSIPRSEDQASDSYHSASFFNGSKIIAAHAHRESRES